MRAETVVGAADALTTDGRIVSIRPVTPSDRQGIAALYDSADPESLRLRFFAQPTPSTLAAEVDRLCRPQSAGLLAMAAYEGTELVGVASCDRDRDGDRPRGEFAVLVADRRHGQGIGTLLLEHLAVRARHHGITEMTGEVLSGNLGMLRVAHEFGPSGRSRLDHGVVDVTVDTGTDGDVCAVIDKRDRIAEHASLRALLAPACVAVIGAGRRPGGAGHEAFRGLRESGFTGRVYAINRSGEPVAGHHTYRSLHALPEAAELLVVAVPADQIGEVLRDGAATGARAAVILTELPDTYGHRRSTELLSLARSVGIRLVGPGSVGVLNTHPDIRLDAGLFASMPPAGGLAIAAQSSAVALALAQHAARTGPGISALVSLGEKADVSGNELLSYWYDDPTTSAVVLHLASFANPARFAHLARALSGRKPVLAIRDPKACATADALYARAGVVVTESVGDLIDAARMLTGQPLAAGRQLTVVANLDGASGIPGLSTADRFLAVDRRAWPAEFAAAAESAAGTTDLLLLVVSGVRGKPAAKFLAALGPVIDRHPELPVAVAVIGDGDPPSVLGARGAPIYDLPERAVRALAHAADYAEWRRTASARPADPLGMAPERARAAVKAALGEGPGRQPAARTAEILGAYGIRLNRDLPEPAVHLVAGTVRDPLFGAMVLLGDGPARLPGDWVLRMAPLSAVDAGRMRRSLRRAPTPTRPSGAALEDLLLRLSRLAENHPEIAGLDLDVLAGPDRVRVTDATLRLGPAGPEPDPALRRLRGPDNR